jgi:hypothetical protein
MVLGMSIEILFANVGYLANPQAKVQYHGYSAVFAISKKICS